MRLSHLFFATLRDDPVDAEMPSHRLLLRAGYLRQLGSGIYSLLPLGQARQRPGRAGHPRGAERDRRPGDGDAGRPPGRHLAGERPLRRDRPGTGPVQGSRRARHGPRDDPRGGRRDPARRHRPLVSPAADDGLSLPDEVARRAPLARRPHPRARVRHEGRLQLRPRRCRARRELPGPVRRLRADLRAARARGRRGVVRRRDHGRDRCPRVHGPQPGRRGRPGPVRVVRLRRQPPGRGRAEARAGSGEAPLPREEVATPGTTTIATLAAFLGIDAEQDGQGGLLHDRRRSPRDGDRARRLRGQRDEARQRRRARSVASGRRRSRRSGRRAWSPATARRSVPTTRPSSSTTWSRAHRTSSPARTARASTTATSTSGATSPPT